MVFRRRRGTYRRHSARRILAKARNARFERRVEAIAKRHMETKAIKWATNIPFSLGWSAANATWIINPFAHMGESSNANGDPSTDKLIGDEFVLRGLKIEWNLAQTRDYNTRVRVSLISTHSLITGLQEGLFNPTAGQLTDIFLSASETSVENTFQRFNDRNVDVLRVKEFRLVPRFSGANADTQGKIYWATDQRKTRNDVDTGDIAENIDFLKGKQYYWVVEMFIPMETSADWSTSTWYDRWQFAVYYKDA